MLLGKRIRELRNKNGVLQRQLASLLEIDTPMLSKIERGDRRAKRAQIVRLANYFQIDEKELLTLWVADKILEAVADENEFKKDALKIVVKLLKVL
ncbi:helix-turn-helix domain-containing protein [Phocaeicola vulgatus]|uniref:helix-turn-helix domain-containing protein n=1 Tax=Phocaeicola vulgatus TaxID=821 RepID=UPI00189CB386|nr:helix-turn-helix transcriptional regulator [Phocaeicola vulgatus]MDC1647357.1 helix-turn-helix transcriptional regulator [Phocaeicola vulgatus]MDC1659636.1 helix-turn-helix transcriptional regulator [Phocaeicola vulgatus]